jgi:hypothetical protein
MKKILLCMVVLCLASIGFSQTTYIANSAVGAAGGTNVFTGANSINLAIAAAVNGDIIYVVPSGVVYLGPAAAVTKSLTIIGGGFNPDKPGALRSTLNGFSIGTVGNFRLSGLDITSGASAGVAFSGSPANIMIDKCRIVYISASSSAIGNMIIEKCILGENRNSSVMSFVSGSTNIRISNNIIYSRNPSAAPGAIRDLNAGLIENNIFIETAAGSALFTFFNVTNCDIRNNIFLGARPQGTGTFTGNTQQNNLSFGASDNTFSTVGNSSISNIQGSDPLFVNLPYGATYLFSYSAQLQAGSPAIGSGVGGINMGIFGGTHSFDVYGTSLPIVQAITPPGTVYQGTNMNVRVQAKGN